VVAAAPLEILTGTVVAQKSSDAVAQALVMAREIPRCDQAGCVEPRARSEDRRTVFSLDLTKISPEGRDVTLLSGSRDS
jgi:hypothetical protein